MLMQHKKKFIILGNMNAVTYKEIFPLLKDNKMWPGSSFNKTLEFCLPDDCKRWDHIDKYGRKVGKGPAIAWYTNLDLKKQHEELIMVKKYTPDEYPHYDNYDAIEVSKVASIPYDYDGVMGVPITFLDKYSPDQFEIIGMGCGWNGNSPLVLRKYPQKQKQIDKNGKVSIVGKLNDGTPLIKVDKSEVKGTYYEVDGNYYIRTYGRVLIRNKHPEEVDT